MKEKNINIKKRYVAERGWTYLKEVHTSGTFPLYRGPSRRQCMEEPAREVFSTIMIVDVLLKYYPQHHLTQSVLRYIQQQHKEGIFSFFEDKSLITSDADTTSLGCTTLHDLGYVSLNKLQNAAENILKHRDEKGIIQVWLSEKGDNYQTKPVQTIDHVVAANALSLLHLTKKEFETTATEEWLYTLLSTHEFEKGSRFYDAPDAFLYFMHRLTTRVPHLKKKFLGLLRNTVDARIGKTEYVLDITMRVIMSKDLGLPYQKEQKKLMGLQEINGSWPADALFNDGRIINPKQYYGSRALSTAFALRVLMGE